MTKTKIDNRKITSGVKEWASSSVNIYSGCENNCRYCYAKKMAIRFERKTEETWKNMELNQKAYLKNYQKRSGRIMFPTSHDITKTVLHECYITLKKLLSAGNDVLITTKPDLWCVHELTRLLEEFKEHIQFRFTITSLSNKRLKFWEPGAPNYEERLQSLQLAFRRGFKTSISIEPYLDRNLVPLVQALAPFSTESIWIGKMNYIQSQGLGPAETRFYTFQREICTWRHIKSQIQALEKLPVDIRAKLRLKDSIQNICKKKKWRSRLR